MIQVYQQDYPILDFGVGAGGSLPAKIKSKIEGEDNTYFADLYEDNPDNAATKTDIRVKIMQLVTTETVPADTWLLVTQIGSDGSGNTLYWGQVPVWL